MNKKTVLTMALSAVTGAVVYHFILGEIEYQKALAEWDSAMTSMFNSVPKEQRYGFVDDFPEGTRWQL